MVEKFYFVSQCNSKTVETLISDDNVDINHIILPYKESLPTHTANSNVYMIILRGGVSIKLNDQEEHTYQAGYIVNIPIGTQMKLYNKDLKCAEFFIVKSPSTKSLEARSC